MSTSGLKVEEVGLRCLATLDRQRLLRKIEYRYLQTSQPLLALPNSYLQLFALFEPEELKKVAIALGQKKKIENLDVGLERLRYLPLAAVLVGWRKGHLEAGSIGSFHEKRCSILVNQVWLSLPVPACGPHRVNLQSLK